MCLLVSSLLAAYGTDADAGKAARLQDAMKQAGSPPEDCKNLADRCDVDASGHYIEIQNQFHVTVTQHCCQLFLEQESNPGMWAGTVNRKQMIIAGETGTVHQSTIQFTNGIEWVKMGAITTTPSPNPSSASNASPCAPVISTSAALPTIPIHSNPCAIIHPVQIPTLASAPAHQPTLAPAPAQGSTTSGGMTKSEIWWAVGSGVAGAIGIGAIAGGAAYIHHEVMKNEKHTTTLPLPPKPIISRKSAAPHPSGASLRGRNASDNRLLQIGGQTYLLVGLGVSILFVISIGFSVIVWKKSHWFRPNRDAGRDVICSREACSRDDLSREEFDEPEFDDLAGDGGDSDVVYE